MNAYDISGLSQIVRDGSFAVKSLSLSNSAVEEAVPSVSSSGEEDHGFILNLFVIFFVAVVLALLVMKIVDFQAELRYVNSEIYRTHGEEKDYWKARRKRLWLSLLPFVRFK